MGWEYALFAAFSLLAGHEQSVAAQNAAANQIEATNAQLVAAAEDANDQIAELQRQRADVNEQKAEEKSDRIRAADRELASLRVASAEGFAMGDRIAAEIGFFEGTDLSRIENSRQNALKKLGADQTAISKSVASANRAGLASMKASKSAAKAASQQAYINAAGKIIDTGMKMYGPGAGGGGATRYPSYGQGAGLQIGGQTGLSGGGFRTKFDGKW